MPIHPLLPIDEHEHSRYAQKNATTQWYFRKELRSNRKTTKSGVEKHCIAQTVLWRDTSRSVISYTAQLEVISEASTSKSRPHDMCFHGRVRFIFGRHFDTPRMDQVHQEVSKQEHKQLAFSGETFTGAQKNWTTYEKTLYAIVKTSQRMVYLFWGPQRVDVFTDHQKLLSNSATPDLRPSLPRHVLTNVHRWAIHLSRFEFLINHISGANNIFANTLTRWSKRYRNTRAQRTEVVAALSRKIVPAARDIDLVATEDTLKEQDK